MTIQACLECGSRRLSMPKFKDGMVPETDNLAEYVCDACGFRGVPLEFEKDEDYQTFVEQLPPHV